MTKRKIKMSTLHSSKKYSSKKDISSKVDSDDYRADHHSEGSYEEKVLKPVSTYLTTMMNFEIYRSILQSQKYNEDIPGKIAKM